MNGIGLVLAGGGGKGAYQIGVWKYLRECGLDRYVCAVTGTSVGAFTAALFCAGNFEKADEIWKNIAPEQILSPKKFSSSDIMRWIRSVGIAQVIPNMIPGIAAGTMATLTAHLASVLGRTYAFSRDGMLEIMRNGVNFSNIQTSTIPCYATCLEIPGCVKTRFDLRDYSVENIQTILLASSAIPLIFDNVDFQGKRYCDGGLPIIGDNVPVKPIYDLGLDMIIVVHLSQSFFIDRAQYSGSRIIEIVPQVDLGGPIDGTLDFTESGSSWRIQQGYKDADRVFGMFTEIAKMRRINEILLQAWQKSEQSYSNRKRALAIKEEELMKQRQNDGFDELCHSLGVEP